MKFRKGKCHIAGPGWMPAEHNLGLPQDRIWRPSPILGSPAQEGLDVLGPAQQIHRAEMCSA